MKLSVQDLDKKICDIYGYSDNDETLREYILDTEDTFKLEPKDLSNITDNELNKYVVVLDHYWNTYMKLSQSVNTKDILKDVLVKK